MKKINHFFAALIMLFLSFNATAQSKSGADYFIGKWNVLVKGTPGGDSKMCIVLDKKDAILTGVVQDSTGAEIAKIDTVELAGDKVIAYFKTQGYDVNLEMNKKDEDHITGSLMGMFEAEGERAKKGK